MLNLDLVRFHCPILSGAVFTGFTTEIPVNEYYEYFGPDYELDVKSSNMEDMNTPGYLERVKGIVLENLRHIGGPPSVQMSGAFIPFTSMVSFHELNVNFRHPKPPYR